MVYKKFLGILKPWTTFLLQGLAARQLKQSGVKVRLPTVNIEVWSRDPSRVKVGWEP